MTFYVHHQPVDYLVIIKTLIFFPIFDAPKFIAPLISVGWSLSYEIYFYVIIGLALLLKKNIIEKLLVLLVFLSVLGIFWNPDSVLLKFLTSPMLLEFSLGMFCGVLYQRFIKAETNNNKKQLLAIALALLGASLMCVTIFIDVDFDIHMQNSIENNNILAFYRVLIWGIPSAIFLLWVIFLEKSFRMNVSFILTLAGDASYSAYLIHGMVYPVVASFSKKLHVGPILYLVIAVPICIGVSIIFYKIIEKPLVTGIDKLLKYKRPVIMK